MGIFDFIYLVCLLLFWLIFADMLKRIVNSKNIQEEKNKVISMHLLFLALCTAWTGYYIIKILANIL